MIPATAHHLLSGNCYRSFLKPTHQRLLIVLLGGAIALLIQYPICRLRGLVVASTQEMWPRTSNCTVESCPFKLDRAGWFSRIPETGSFQIVQWKKNSNPRQAIKSGLWRRRCDKSAIFVIATTYWTKLAILTRFLTVCDAPDLLKMHLKPIATNFKVEFVLGSTTKRTLCSDGTGSRSQVDQSNHLEIVRRILEYGLFKTSHVHSSLYLADRDEMAFWNSGPSSARRTKENIMATLKELDFLYKSYGMFHETHSAKPVSMNDLETLFRAFLTLCGVILAAPAVNYCWRKQWLS